MKKVFLLILLLLSVAVLSSCTHTNINFSIEKEPSVSSKTANDRQPVENRTDASALNDNTPFYGIWVNATKNQDNAVTFSDEVSSKGFNSFVEVTTDWSNLNHEKWYVVTAGKFASENEAKSELENVKKYYPDAYVKYSGDYVNK